MILTNPGNSFYKQHPGWVNILCNTNFRSPFLVSQLIMDKKIGCLILFMEKTAFLVTCRSDLTTSKGRTRRENQDGLFAAVSEHVSWGTSWRKGVNGCVVQIFTSLPLSIMSYGQKGKKQKNLWLKIWERYWTTSWKLNVVKSGFLRRDMAFKKSGHSVYFSKSCLDSFSLIHDWFVHWFIEF